METLIAATLLFNMQHPMPQCTKRFVNMWQDNRTEALQHMPRRACWYQTDTGRYICSRAQGCHR